MEYEFKLPNGKKIKSNEIKCPICGKIMDIDEGDMTMPRSELVFRDCEPPFSGRTIDSKSYTDITMKCPDECCKIEFTHCDLLYCVGHMNG